MRRAGREGDRRNGGLVSTEDEKGRKKGGDSDRGYSFIDSRRLTVCTR